MLEQLECRIDKCHCMNFRITDYARSIKLTCVACGERYYSSSKIDYIFLNSCSKCKNNTFNVYLDTVTGNILFTCLKCGQSPIKIYLDENGYKIPYNQYMIETLQYRIDILEKQLLELQATDNSVISLDDLITSETNEDSE